MNKVSERERRGGGLKHGGLLIKLFYLHSEIWNMKRKDVRDKNRNIS